MRNLSPPEGTILVELSKQPTYTAQLPMNDGVVMRLSHKMMIQPTSAQHLTDEYLRISYTLTPVALKYIQTHSEFVKQYSVENSAYVYELLKN